MAVYFYFPKSQSKSKTKMSGSNSHGPVPRKRSDCSDFISECLTVNNSHAKESRVQTIEQTIMLDSTQVHCTP